MTGRLNGFALILCCTTSLFAQGQTPGIEPVEPQSSVLWRSWLAPDFPPVRLGNSPRMQDLLRSGNLYLTVPDAIALVLENDIDIEVARYTPLAAIWQVQKAEAGSGSPAPSSPASLATAIVPGQGVYGSVASAGVASAEKGTSAQPGAQGGSNGQVSSSGGGASIPAGASGQIAQNLDPVLQESSVVGGISQPQPNSTLTLSPVLIQNLHASSATVTEGFLTGGSVSATYTQHYLNENAATDILNPSVSSSLAVSVHHNLLRGFGYRVNARDITVARINRSISDLLFKVQVTTAVNQALQVYYGMVAAYENIKTARSSLDVAQRLYEDNRRQVEVGSLPPIAMTAANAQVAAAQRDLISAQASVELLEQQFKSLLSRNGSAEPLLRNVHIIPVDSIVIPSRDDLASPEAMVQEALINRADLAVEKEEIDAAEVSALGSTNGVLPALRVSASESDAGLAGTSRTVVDGKQTQTASPFFSGGTTTSLAQLFRRDFPTDRAGATFEATLSNRSAQADQGIDQLSIRQIQLATQRDINRVQVDLTNSLAMMQQARARHETAVRNRILYAELLDSEQKKYAEGASTSFNVLQQQRDLAGAEYAETASLVTWIQARMALDQTLGTTLDVNHVSIGEAKAGKVARTSAPGRN